MGNAQDLLNKLQGTIPSKTTSTTNGIDIRERITESNIYERVKQLERDMIDAKNKILSAKDTAINAANMARGFHGRMVKASEGLLGDVQNIQDAGADMQKVIETETKNVNNAFNAFSAAVSKEASDIARTMQGTANSAIGHANAISSQIQDRVMFYMKRIKKDALIYVPYNAFKAFEMAMWGGNFWDYNKRNYTGAMKLLYHGMKALGTNMGYLKTEFDQFGSQFRSKVNAVENSVTTAQKNINNAISNFTGAFRRLANNLSYNLKGLAVIPLQLESKIEPETEIVIEYEYTKLYRGSDERPLTNAGWEKYETDSEYTYWRRVI